MNIPKTDYAETISSAPHQLGRSHAMNAGLSSTPSEHTTLEEFDRYYEELQKRPGQSLKQLNIVTVDDIVSLQFGTGKGSQLTISLYVRSVAGSRINCAVEVHHHKLVHNSTIGSCAFQLPIVSNTGNVPGRTNLENLKNMTIKLLTPEQRDLLTGRNLQKIIYKPNSQGGIFAGWLGKIRGIRHDTKEQVVNIF